MMRWSILSVLLTPALALGAPGNARVAPFQGDHAAAISYTFDDNLRDQFELAVPMLNEAGFRGTFFVIPGRTPETHEQAATRPTDPAARAWGSISWADLKTMAGQGHEIASHTWTHPNLTKLAPADVQAQIDRADAAIAAHLGRPPLTLAFPYNASTPAVQAMVLQHHVAFRAYQRGVGGKATADELNRWADQLMAEHKWGVTMTHAIKAGYDAFADPTALRDHFQYVKTRDIWVATFADVARYAKERDGIRLDASAAADGSLSVALASPLDATVYDVPLTVLVDVPAGVTVATATRAGTPLPSRVAHGVLQIDASPAAEPIVIRWK